jgi:hypothetical protein
MVESVLEAPATEPISTTIRTVDVQEPHAAMGNVRLLPSMGLVRSTRGYSGNVPYFERGSGLHPLSGGLAYSGVRGRDPPYAECGMPATRRWSCLE